MPAGGWNVEPLYLSKPRNRGATTGYFWDQQQPHIRLGSTGNATNRYAAYYITLSDDAVVHTPPSVDLSSCHPALLHYDGTLARFHQQAVQSIAVRIAAVQDGEVKLETHLKNFTGKKGEQNLGCRGSERLQSELHSLSASGAIPELKPGLLLCLVRLASLPLTAQACNSGDAVAKTFMWRFGMTIASTCANSVPAAQPSSCHISWQTLKQHMLHTDASMAASHFPQHPQQFVQAISPCFACKTTETTSTVLCFRVPGSAGASFDDAAAEAALLQGSKSSEIIGNSRAETESFVPTLVRVPPNAQGWIDLHIATVTSSIRVQFCPLNELPAAAARITPKTPMPGALHVDGSSDVLHLSMSAMIQQVYYPGMPGSDEARLLDENVWMWPLAVPADGSSHLPVGFTFRAPISSMGALGPLLHEVPHMYPPTTPPICCTQWGDPPTATDSTSDPLSLLHLSSPSDAGSGSDPGYSPAHHTHNWIIQENSGFVTHFSYKGMPLSAPGGLPPLLGVGGGSKLLSPKEILDGGKLPCQGRPYDRKRTRDGTMRLLLTRDSDAASEKSVPCNPETQFASPSNSGDWKLARIV